MARSANGSPAWSAEATAASPRPTPARRNRAVRGGGAGGARLFSVPLAIRRRLRHPLSHSHRVLLLAVACLAPGLFPSGAEAQPRPRTPPRAAAPAAPSGVVSAIEVRGN